LTQPIHCLIIEDEAGAAAIIRDYCTRLPELALKGWCRSMEEALPVLRNTQIDLVFLDIHLPGASGLELARELQASAAIVFVTAYAEHALKGFDLAAVDYLLKPVAFDRFRQAVDRFCQIRGTTPVAPAETPFIVLRIDRKMQKVFLGEIRFIEARGNALEIRLGEHTLRTYQPIAELEEKLPEGLFLRTHRSFIVSIRQILSYTATEVLTDAGPVPVGRLYQQRVEQRLRPYFGK
jgi:DNA-binding LytR/AlgR family response regulator